MTFDNRIFMGATATFDEMVFPCHKENTVPETTRFGDKPSDDEVFLEEDLKEGEIPTPGMNGNDDDNNSSSDDSNSSGGTDRSLKPVRPLYK